MKRSNKTIASLFAALTLMVSPAVSFAGATEDRLDALEKEISTLKNKLESSHGLSGETTLGGYGELHFNDYKNNNKDSAIDFHRFVLFFGHEFNDWVSFHAELEVEHSLAGEGKPGEVELEQAYIDLRVSEPLNFRAGLMLMPIGFLNETHDPDAFYGVERPDVEKNIIPTTWWEAGAGIFGEVAEGLSYKLYMVSTPNAANFKADGSSGIRSGRQKVAKAVAEDFGVTGRLEYSAILGLKVGVSYFGGHTSQGDDSMGSAKVEIKEADFQFSKSFFDLKGLYAEVELGDADKVNAFLCDVICDGTDDGTLGDKMTGAYVEAAVRLFSLMDLDTDQELTVFVRHSEYNTHDSVTGFTANPAYDIEIHTIGLDYKPHDNVVFKVDFQNRDNASKDPADKATDQINIGMGYSF